jgi:hypothetical protein
MKTKKFLYDQELTHSFTKMNGIKIIDSLFKMFCPIQIGRTRPKLAGQIAEQTASRTE